MIEVTLTLPDDLYRQAERQAELRQQSVDSLLSDILAESIQKQMDHNDDPVEKELVAYRAMHDQLYREYAGHHVAIFQGNLVDHDQDGAALSQRIYARFPDEFVLIRQVSAEPERVLHFRSPRLIKEA